MSTTSIGWGSVDAVHGNSRRISEAPTRVVTNIRNPGKFRRRLRQREVFPDPAGPFTKRDWGPGRRRNAPSSGGIAEGSSGRSGFSILGFPTITILRSVSERFGPVGTREWLPASSHGKGGAGHAPERGLRCHLWGSSCRWNVASISSICRVRRPFLLGPSGGMRRTPPCTPSIELRQRRVWVGAPSHRPPREERVIARISSSAPERRGVRWN